MFPSEFREERASCANSRMLSTGEKPEIAFFDVETTIPTRPGQGFAILEFGALLVCSQKLIELENYSTLVRPKDLNLISGLSVRCNGITEGDVVSAPSFAEIADKVYELLHGRIWAGHNILRFDCARIKEAFADINKPPPVPKATIDSLELLTQRFGRRAGNMKMATLATYFGLGQQTHRSLDDVRMNLEVLKYCATVLLLESSLPDIFAEKSWVSPNSTRRSHNKGQASQEGTRLDADKSSSSGEVGNCVIQSCVNQLNGEINSSLPYCSRNQGLPCLVGSSNATANSFDMGRLRQEVERDCLLSDDSMEEEEEEEEEELEATGPTSRESSSETGSHGLIECGFLEPDEISIPSISVILAPFYRGTEKVQILHKGISLEICCKQLKVRFGVSTKFVDAAGRPRLSCVADASPSLCEILDISDALAQKLSTDSGSTSEWRPVVTRKAGFVNSPTIRLHLLTCADGNMVRWITEIYRKSFATQRLDFSNPMELESLLTPGGFIDAYFSLDTYDYQQGAGIRLVAKKLVIHS